MAFFVMAVFFCLSPSRQDAKNATGARSGSRPCKPWARRVWAKLDRERVSPGDGRSLQNCRAAQKPLIGSTPIRSRQGLAAGPSPRQLYGSAQIPELQIANFHTYWLTLKVYN